MWICESCGTENQEEDEHCQMCDTWRIEQEGEEDSGPTPDELRARAAELEQRVPPIEAGPRTDMERVFLEKAAALRSTARLMEADTTAARAGEGS